jgi:hypothetical protein
MADARIPPGCPIYYGQGRVLCAGEAAGFLNPWARVSRLRWRADIMQPARLWSIGMSRSAPWRATGTDERPAGLHAAPMEFYRRHGGDVPGDEDVRRRLNAE